MGGVFFLEKTRTKGTVKNTFLPKTILVIAVLTLAVSICFCVSAFLITKYDFSAKISDWFALISVAVPMLFCSYTARLLFDEKGSWIGLGIAIFLFFSILCFALMMGQSTFTIHSLILLLFLIIPAMIGSNLAANALDKKRKHLH